MKKLFCIAALTLVAIETSAQGTVVFANSAATAITVNLNGYPPPGPIVVGLFGSTSLGLGQNDSSLTMIGNPAPLLIPAGRFSDGNREIGAANSTVTLQVRAWSAAFSTELEARLAGAPWGKSQMWEQATGGGESNPPEPITGPGRFEPLLVTLVPEPSKLALGLLGLAAAALFRRQK